MRDTWHRWHLYLDNKPNTEISWTVRYKNASRCSKNPLFLMQYFKFWNPCVKQSSGHQLKRKFDVVASLCIALRVWRNNCLYQSGNVSRTCDRHYFSATSAAQCCWEHVYILQLSCMKICRTAEYLNASRSSKNLLVPIQLGAVRKDLTDLLACGVVKLS